MKKGSCSITQKVRNIEEAGGHVAIIINDKDENVEEMFLADDGHEGDISIPAILISQTDGIKIINYYERPSSPFLMAATTSATYVESCATLSALKSLCME